MRTVFPASCNAIETLAYSRCASTSVRYLCILGTIQIYLSQETRFPFAKNVYFHMGIIFFCLRFARSVSPSVPANQFSNAISKCTLQIFVMTVYVRMLVTFRVCHFASYQMHWCTRVGRAHSHKPRAQSTADYI